MGSHRVKVSARGVEAGSYVLALQAGNGLRVRKVLVAE